MRLPKLTDLEVRDKKVLVRADLDLPSEALAKEGVAESSLRLKMLLPTLNYLLKNQARQIIILGHRGRPSGSPSLSLSLREVGESLSNLLKEKILFLDQIEDLKPAIEKDNEKILLLENLRFDIREEENSKEFAKDLVNYGEIYVNEAFAVSHRVHASIVALPHACKSKCQSKSGCVAAGFRFVQEIDNLSKVLENPKRPVVLIISGVKKDKLDYLEKFKKIADKILIGGRLPEYIEKTPKIPASPARLVAKQAGRQNSKNPNNKILLADLLPDKEDITLHSIEKFEAEIKNAKTVVVSGPISRFEEEGHRQGTRRIFKAVVANKEAFKIAGGGETEKALSVLSEAEGFDWISVGGGAMLEYLAYGTLPGIEALRN